jgi:hypothetical protein
MAKNERPEWLIKSHIKDIDLHGYQSIDLALEQVQKGLATAKKHDNNTYKFIPGRGTHSEMNQFGRKYKETKNWKRDIDPLLLEAVRTHLKSVTKEFYIFEMPGKDKTTEIYVRYKGGNSVGKRTMSPYLSNDLLPPSFESVDED